MSGQKIYTASEIEEIHNNWIEAHTINPAEKLTTNELLAIIICLLGVNLLLELLQYCAMLSK